MVSCFLQPSPINLYLWNVTNFLFQHPGVDSVISAFVEKDTTAEFEMIHHTPRCHDRHTWGGGEDDDDEKDDSSEGGYTKEEGGEAEQEGRCVGGLGMVVS